jgi:uncharacterized protein YkwD
MLKSFLLAGLFLASTNLMSSHLLGVPNVLAAPPPSLPRTAVKHSAQLLTPAPGGATLKFVAPSLGFPSRPLADALRPEESEFIQRINAERVSRGLNALTVDPLLVQVARSHSQEMCDLNYFDHHSPTASQITPMDRYVKGLHDSGLDTPAYLLVGENIFYCSVFNDTYNVAYGHQALMNSPGHRANILEPRFARVGVGTYQDSHGQFWVTEMFLKDQQ